MVKFSEKVKNNKDVVTVITSIVALCLSLIAFFRSFPGESKIALRPGSLILLYNYADNNSIDKDIYKQNGTLRMRVPMTIINTGGKSATIDKIRIKLENLTDSKDNLILDWQAFMRPDKEDYYVFDEYPTSIYLNAKSSTTKLIVFTGGDASKKWHFATTEYRFIIYAQLSGSLKLTEVTTFKYTFTKNDLAQFGFNMAEGIGRGIWINPDYLQIIK